MRQHPGRRPRLKKKLGQHHLTRPESCRPLLEFLRPENSRVLEVGPGGGVLTEALVGAGASVCAVELDAEWAAHLVIRRLPGVQVLIADALQFPWGRLPSPTLVCGNLPYNVGTSILISVLPHYARVPRAGFLLQLEVAQRLTADPCTRSYGSLSVLAQLYSKPQILGRVKPGAFRPPPKVESAFVGFTLRQPVLAPEDLGAFERLVRQGFSHKRKTLRNALSQGWGRERVDPLLESAGLPDSVRAEELPLEDWIRLYRRFESEL